ncbi:spore germination protein [Paenibacillus harenae]|uniref:spore germination protein n=1 Tax=Paenibacillus harenae TaxID=306543 RepID=UPI003593590F
MPMKKQNNGADSQGSEQANRLSSDIEDNIRYAQDTLGTGPDILIRRLHLFQESKAAVLSIAGITDKASVNLLVDSMLSEYREQSGLAREGDPFQALLYRMLAVGGIRSLETLYDLDVAMLEGLSVVLLDGYDRALAVNTGGGERRGVEEPSTQTVVRGPKEGFAESILTNISLLRTKIKSPNLRIEYKIIGQQTRTTVAVAYMKGISEDKVVNEVHRRLDAIETDSILDSGYIEEFIHEKKYSPFPLLQNTERPDAIAAGLLEGQVAIIVDGSPFALLAPVTFFKFFQSSEDYYQSYDIATFLRVIRFVSFFASMLLPSLYIAITTFHQEMLPTPLLISIAAQREGVPFPAIIEAMIMELTFEILREAGVRMPRIIGSAISIVGALVLGQAAVQAGLISAAMVIVVSFTAIASFVIPAVNMGTSARLIRFAMMILAGSFGVFGIMAGLMVLLTHLSGLRSFGVPYLTPISPLVKNNLKDVFVRAPWWAMNKRPALFGKPGTSRQGKQEKKAISSQSGKSGEEEEGQ